MRRHQFASASGSRRRRGALLNHVGEFVGNHLAARVGLRLVLAAGEKHVLTASERAGANRVRQRLRIGAEMEPYGAEISSEAARHVVAQGALQRLAPAQRGIERGFKSRRRRIIRALLRGHHLQCRRRLLLFGLWSAVAHHRGILEIGRHLAMDLRARHRPRRSGPAHRLSPIAPEPAPPSRQLRARSDRRGG